MDSTDSGHELAEQTVATRADSGPTDTKPMDCHLGRPVSPAAIEPQSRQDQASTETKQDKKADSVKSARRVMLEQARQASASTAPPDTIDEIEMFIQREQQRIKQAEAEASSKDAMATMAKGIDGLGKFAQVPWLKAPGALTGEQGIQDHLRRVLTWAHEAELAQPELKQARRHLFCDDQCEYSYLYSILAIKQCQKCKDLEAKLLAETAPEKREALVTSWYYTQRTLEIARWKDAQREQAQKIKQHVITAEQSLDPMTKLLLTFTQSLMAGAASALAKAPSRDQSDRDPMGPD